MRPSKRPLDAAIGRVPAIVTARSRPDIVAEMLGEFSRPSHDPVAARDPRTVTSGRPGTSTAFSAGAVRLNVPVDRR